MTVRTTFRENGDKVVEGTDPRDGTAYRYVIRDDVVIESWSESPLIDSATGTRRFDPETGLPLVDGHLPVPDVVVTDDAPGAPWTRRMEFHDALGEVERIVTLRADGVTVEEWMHLGQVSQRWLYDAGDAYDWMSEGQELDASGTVRAQIVRTDDLVERYTEGHFESGPYRLTISLDPGDVFDWFWVEENHEAGILRDRVTVFDDAVIRTETFSATGLPLRVEETDPQDARFWDWRIKEYDAAGRLLAEDQIHDDGIVQMRDFVDGVHLQTEWSDDDDATWWSERGNHYDIATGALLYQWLLRDDGIEFSTTFEDGVAVREVLFDTENIRDWTSRTKYLDATGATVEETVRYDDGTLTERLHKANGIERVRFYEDDPRTLYRDDLLLRAEWHDRADAYWWDMRAKVYAPDGSVSSTVLRRDDGISTETVFTGDAITAVILTDTLDIRPWQTRTETFATASAPVSLAVVLDDGVEERSSYHWSTGFLTSFTARDLRDAHDWDRREIEYDDATGAILREWTWNDDGVEERIDYRDGIATYSHEVDTLDVHDWDHVVWQGPPGMGSGSRFYDDGVIHWFSGPEEAPIESYWEDDEEAHDWAWYEWKRDPGTGELTSYERKEDDGSSLREVYVDGFLDSSEAVDMAAAEWLTQNAWYDAGVLQERETTFADGIVREERFDPSGRLASLAETDPEDVRDWATRRETYDRESALLEWAIVHDNGVEQVRRHEAGQHRTTTWTDRDDVHWWAEKSVTYDPAGEVVSDTILRDDGIRTERTQQNAGRSVVDQTDTADIRDWEQISQIFDEATGILQIGQTAFDDGILEFARYSASGMLSSLERIDTKDIYDWQSTFRIFPTDEATRDVNTVVSDDGIKTVDEFAFGELTRTWVYENPTSWDLVEETQYDEAGARLLHREFAPNGLEWISFYEGGLIREKRTIDHEDAYSWQERTRIYDETGEIVSFVQVNDPEGPFN